MISSCYILYTCTPQRGEKRRGKEKERAKRDDEETEIDRFRAEVWKTLHFWQKTCGLL